MLVTNWIDGRRADGADSSRPSPIMNPATGAVTGSVAVSTTEQVAAAIASSQVAARSWAEVPLTRRQKVMFAYRQLLIANADELARLITSEHGKTTADALGEVQRGIEVVEFACNIAHLLKGEFSGQVSTGIDTYTIRQPLGVCAGITPFNFPVMVPLWMFPMAIAAGNAFILKPSERDPSPSMLLAELFSEAGLPDGVLNVVHGDREAVEAILRHPGISAVSFVGSTPVARYVYETAAAEGKRVQALGGAKNHMVVMPDADVDVAADAAVSAAYGSAGERCMAISIAVCVGNAAEPFVAAVEDRIRTLRVGPGGEEGSEMGPLITSEHRDRVAGYIASGTDEGAELRIDGRELRIPTCPDGFFLGPTLFDHVSTGMRIYRDEIFGPVLGVVRVPDLDEAIRLINENPYGNGTAVFTGDGAAVREFQHRITVGMVGINVPLPVPLSFYSFGGWKQSIFGAHAIYGPDAVHFYSRQKVVISRWPSRSETRLDLNFPTHGGKGAS